ncbi:phosphoglycerate mutase [Diaporthe helianthi]|uniref:Phosphoglycerate mutase n=1 Tax=Diaporthe helianthi TaxID=158607 RepID=A0A2P5HSF6_DIAHE|nr:phosphoglycerate mutase [Diaporthe helianthi]
MTRSPRDLNSELSPDDKHGWESFLGHIHSLNQEGKAKYKLFYYIRHGEGYHNVKEAEVGTAEWEGHWARLDGDDTRTWVDAHLTEKGKQQALAISTFLKSSEAQNGMPVPSRHYTSPLARCLETTRLAFSEHEGAEGVKAIVKENLRERMGIHTCGKRRTRTWIQENYRSYQIEDGFAEHDELWQGDVRESLEEHALRFNDVLRDIFANDDEVVISLTSHSGSIRALYAAIGHRDVWVSPAAMVPVLIKALSV